MIDEASIRSRIDSRIDVSSHRQRRLGLVVSFALSLAACGGGASEGTGPGYGAEIGGRGIRGDCVASFSEETGLTDLVVPLSPATTVEVALPGDGWEGRCDGPPERRVYLENRADEWIASIAVEAGTQGPIDTPLYASRQAEATGEHLMAQGFTEVEGVPRMIDDDLYVLAFSMRYRDRPIMHLDAHRVLQTAEGLLRFHISTSGDDPDRMNQRVATLIRAAQTFGPASGGDRASSSPRP